MNLRMLALAVASPSPAGLTLAASAVVALAASAAVAAPPLGALAAWQAGHWRHHPAGGVPAAPQCLGSPDRLLLAGRPNAHCRFNVIADGPDMAAVTYHCADGRQGRTEIRRDTADIYTIDAQGVEDGRPFAIRSEWRRDGGC